MSRFDGNGQFMITRIIIRRVRSGAKDRWVRDEKSEERWEERDEYEFLCVSIRISMCLKDEILYKDSKGGKKS